MTRWLSSAGLTPCLLLGGTLLAVGCGGTSGDFATVEGTVTLDGAPLPEALVTFRPEDGSPSYGRTDVNGRYQLEYSRSRKGAEIGQHVVSISTRRAGDPDEDPPVAEVPERAPVRYNVEAANNPDMKVEVTKGRNRHDFVLSSDGEVFQPAGGDD